MNRMRNNPWGFPAPDMRQMMERFMGAEDDQSDVVTSQWTPRVDVKEEAERFVIFADVPGVEPKDIEVHMENGVLTIRGERETEEENEGERFTRVERTHGLFYRRFALPDTADSDAISASGRHGVLEISIPKRGKDNPRRIEVK